MKTLQRITALFAVSLLIFCTSTSAIDEADNDKRDMMFKSLVSYRLVLPLAVKNITRKTTKVSNNIHCAFACVRESWCHSANFEAMSTKTARLHKCELMSLNGDNFPGALTKDERYIHFIKLSVDPCSRNPCLNGGVCEPLSEKMNDYRCHCRKGYDGKKCENEGLEMSLILRYHDNSRYLKTLTSYLVPVLQDPRKSRWVRCWHAASDGWDVTKTFHPQCDGKGPTVTIIRVDSYVFGGYTDISWHRTGTYSKSLKSFLYSLYNTNGYQPAKMELLGLSNNEAVYGQNDHGPTFGGGHDLYISNQATTNRDSYCQFSSYRPIQGCDRTQRCSVLAGSGEFRPSDIEVFYETKS